ncbi:MAG: peptidoglycan DD-metalloendopeptidase family protein [Patescibacteria group bacterium]|jgi:murein DD-endopeptidase MepM/ murein hydrolase activator NlpD|nr:peptidoglycan DD-metalloendopeptidase family protein [Patescibacteria group bacterium]
MKKSLLFFFFTLFLFFQPVFVLADDYSQEIEDIQKKIEEQQKIINDLETQKKIYQEKIEIKRNEAVNLKNQISILTDQMVKREIEIQEKEMEISSANLSVKKIQFKILEKKQEEKILKDDIKGLLKAINQYDQKNLLEMIFLKNSLSEVFNHVRYLSTLQGELAQSLKRIELIKEGLEIQEKDLRVQLQTLVDLKSQLNNEKSKLLANKQTKETILDETRGVEWKFQSLLAETITEQKQIENEINFLEKEVREKIAEEKEKKAEFLEKEGTIVFSWPVPTEGITCRFHDPDYPYKNWIGEHSGLDLRAKQGTSIRAAASGYVARAKHGGLGYSYIMIIHNDSFSSLYGHVSKILVQEGEYVKRGTVIALSGGLPGTPGAGSFSTGPHLHFEIRLNGLPVNPEDHLL